MAVISGDIDPMLLQRLGRVVTLWAGVEEWQARFLSFLVDANITLMPFITATASAATVMGWIRPLSAVRFPSPLLQEKFTELFTRTDDARDERNTLVHGIWGSEGEPGAAIVQTMQLNRSEILKSHLVTLADLDELAEEIRWILAQFSSVGETLGFGV